MLKRIIAGIAIAGLLAVALTLPQSTSAADANWTGYYYQNINLAGTPVVREDAVISFDWEGAPPDWAVGWSGDNFSVRWVKTDHFDSGVYVFAASSDDGIRVYVDGVRIIDEWYGRQGHWTSVEREMSPGEHRIVVEYFEETGRAMVQAGYYRKDGATTSGSSSSSSGSSGSSSNATSTPIPTSTRIPTPTATPPYVVGTPGAGDVVAEVGPPPIESTMVIEEYGVKAFAWRGFPGPVARLGGHGGRHSYVKNRNTKPSFQVRWLFQFQSSGFHDVYAYIPIGENATNSATYYVVDANGRSAPIIIDQAANRDRWIHLGTYYFISGQEQYVYLDNVTGEDTASKEVLLDAMMFVFSP